MEFQKNVKLGHLPFLERDIRILYCTVKRKKAKNDVMELLEHCRIAKQTRRRKKFGAYPIFWSPRLVCFDWY